MHESGFITCYQPKVTKEQWLLLLLCLDPNGSQVGSSNEQHYRKLARNVDPQAPPSPLKSEFALSKIQKTCITLKLEKQWVNIQICWLRNF